MFEADAWIGGHTHTVDVDEDGRSVAVDTGFIVFNHWTYPNFIAMLERLGVGWQPSNMSFSLQCERTGLEYNGTSLDSLFAQRRNLLRPSFLHMIWEILRFNREAPRFLAEQDETTTLGEWLRARGFGRNFTEHYVVPMGRAIWSAEAEAILRFPARFFIDFFHRHGFLSVDDRPQWKGVRFVLNHRLSVRGARYRPCESQGICRRAKASCWGFGGVPQSLFPPRRG